MSNAEEGQGAAFDPRACVLCGCTDEAACEGGCTWVHHEPDLCSSCAKKAGAEAEAHVLEWFEQYLRDNEYQADLRAYEEAQWRGPR